MWRDVSRHVRTRSDVQCRYWWGVIKRCEALEWREEEDAYLRKAVEQYNSIPDADVKAEDWELLVKLFSRKCSEGRKGGFSQPRTPHNLVTRCVQI